jgi:hypothetical protein
MGTEDKKLTLCTLCLTERKFVFGRYRGVKLDPPRCMACIVSFPPKGINHNNERKTYLSRIKHDPHFWVLTLQTHCFGHWFCGFCRLYRISPGPGVPRRDGCIASFTKVSFGVFWALSSLQMVKCPRCFKSAYLAKEKLYYAQRPSRRYFPYYCLKCDRKGLKKIKKK